MTAQRFRAPGRVNLIGEHTDYSGGLVLPAAIDRAVVVEGAAHPSRIRLRSERFPELVDVPADGAEPPLSGWGRYLSAVAAELHALGRPPVGFDGVVRSDLPDGAGLSSSAALCVAVAVALCAVADFTVPPMDLAAAAQRAEQRAVGVPVGIMDQAASILGRAGHAVLLDCGTGEYRHVPLPADLVLLVIDSGVRRRLEGSGYARRRAELEEGLAVLGGRRAADVDASELPALTAGLPDIPRRRLRHVVTENERVRQTEAALTAKPGPDLAALGSLFAASHASLHDDFEVSTPELDQLVDLAYANGAVAARMTGGGFGGAIVALAPADHEPAIGAAVANAYARQGRTATALTCHVANGAGAIR